MMQLQERTKMKSINKGQFIFFPEDPSKTIFFLKEGRVKVGSYTDDGSEIIKTILEPGEIFGELGLAGEEKRNDFAEAMDDTVVVCALGLQEMEGMMQMNPNLSLKVTKLMGFRLRKIERRLESLFFKDVRTRIVDFLREMAKEKGERIGFEIIIHHRLTHRDIASLTATTRQTVTTILNELKADNIIFFDRKKILIRDLERLK